MLRHKLATLLLALSVSVSGCAISPKAQTTKIGDNELTKEAIVKELAELDRIEKKIEGNKGFTGKNAAALVFFWPALAYTYIDANDAQKKVDQRRNYLNNLYNTKSATQKA